MLTKEFRAEHTEIPWEQMIGLRHVLVHGYYTIKPKQLWNIIEKDIPILLPQIVSVSAFIPCIIQKKQ